MSIIKKTSGYLLLAVYIILIVIISNPNALADGSKPTAVNNIIIEQENVNLIKLPRLDSIDNLTRLPEEEPIAKSIKEQIPSDEGKRCPEWKSKFKEYGLPVDVFSYIAFRESSCNEKAINAKFDKNGNVTWTLNKNGSIYRGLVQINSCWKSVVKDICGTSLDGLLNVDCNLKVAKYILENTKGGLGNWGFK